MKDRATFLTPDFRYNPVLCFLVFLASNVFLSYFPSSLAFKVTIGFAGLAIPFLLAVAGIRSENRGKKAPYTEEFIQGDPFWPFVALFSAAIVLRFYLFAASLKNMPSLDDAINAYYSIDLLENWKWKIFIGPVQIPPLFNWCATFFFEFLTPSIFSMKLLLFLLSIPLLFVACVPKIPPFSNSLSFLFGCGIAFTFWPLYAGQVFFGFVPALALELAVLILLGRLSHSPDDPSRRKEALALGMATGTGFFLAIPWVLVAMAVCGTMIYLNRRGGNRTSLKLFFISFFPFLLFFVFFSVLEGNGGHVKSLVGFPAGGEWEKRLSGAFRYVTALFWGCEHESYGPAWGGMLNPIWGSFFFAGALESWRMRKRGLIVWLWSGLILFLVPGLISKNFEVFRIFQTLPFLLAVSGLGIQAVFAKIAGRKKYFAFGLLLAISLLLDLRHLKIAYRNNSPEEPQFSKAYGILRDKYRESGPGSILLDLRPNIWDQTLDVAVYPFNQLVNRHPSDEGGKWMAVFVNEHYVPYLRDRFPGASWVGLGDDLFWHYGEMFIGILEVTPENETALMKWEQLDLYFKAIRSQTMNCNSGHCLGEIISEMLASRRVAGGDPFLESIVTEKLLFSKLTCQNPGEAVEIIRQGLKKGYPLANFFTTEGVYLCGEGRYGEAREAFESAVRSRLDRTPAKEYLAQMEGRK